MLEMRRLVARDVFDIEKRAETRGIEDLLTLETHSYSILDEGRLVGIGGLVPKSPGRDEVWAVLAPRVRHLMPEITNLVRLVLDRAETNRIECAVRCDFPAGHQWAHMLGFTAEAECLAAYDSEGYDCSMYARVKKRRKGKL